MNAGQSHPVCSMSQASLSVALSQTRITAHPDTSFGPQSPRSTTMYTIDNTLSAQADLLPSNAPVKLEEELPSNDFHFPSPVYASPSLHAQYQGWSSNASFPQTLMNAPYHLQTDEDQVHQYYSHLQSSDVNMLRNYYNNDRKAVFSVNNSAFNNNNELDTVFQDAVKPETDINNNNNNSFITDTFLMDKARHVSDARCNAGGKVTNLPPLSEFLWQLDNQSGIYSDQRMCDFDETDNRDSVESRTSSCSSIGTDDEICFRPLTDADAAGKILTGGYTFDYDAQEEPQFLQMCDTSRFCDQSSVAEYILNEMQASSSLLNPGYHDNSGIESPQFRNYEPSPVAQHYLCRSNVDPSNVYSNLSSSETDEGYDEGSPWPLVPDFNQLEQVPDPERDSQHNRSFSESPKERKKAVRELLPLAEKERRKPGRKPGQVSNVLHLWEFMRDLLHSANSSGIIEWISQIDGVFRVLNSTEVARLWGEKKKNKKKMTYEKLSRSLRYSRLEGYFADLPKDKNYPKKLCFKFGPKSKDWH